MELFEWIDDTVFCPKCGETWDIEPINYIETDEAVYEVLECKNCGHRWIQILP